MAITLNGTISGRSFGEVRLTKADRAFWAWMKRVWPRWNEALIIVKPDTVLARHRRGFRLFWTWRVRHGRPGRPSIPQEIRDLIRIISRNNPRWGAPAYSWRVGEARWTIVIPALVQH